MPSMSDAERPLIGWLAAFSVVVLWSGWVVISRLGVLQTLTIYDMVALRFFVASIAVTPFVWRHWPRQLSWWKVTLFSFGQGAPYLMLAFSGLQFAPASHAGIIMNGTLPVLTALLAWLWLKEIPSGWRVTGMGVVLIGCSLIGWDRQSVGAGPDAWVGHIMFMAAALFVAVNLIATKAWQLTATQAMVSIPTINLLWFGPLYITYLPKALSDASWAQILLQGAYQGLGPSILGVLCFTTAIRRIGTSSTAAMMALVPGMAALLAIPVLGEWPSALAWGGLLLATGGILLAAGWQPRLGRGNRTTVCKTATSIERDT